MGEFLNAMSAVLVLLMLMSVGYFMGQGGWMTGTEKKFLSRFIVNIAVPCTCITGVLNNLDRTMLFSALIMLAACFAGVVLTLGVSALVGKLLKLPRERFGVFVAMGGLSNTLFIGLPVTTQLFGDACIPYVMIYYLANTVLVQTVGILLIEHAGGKQTGNSPFAFIKSVFQKPPILGVVAAIVLLVAGLRPPELLMRFAGYISGTVSPLALMYCGFVLYEVGIKNLRFSKGIPTMLVIRLVLAPLLCYGMCAVMNVTGFPQSVFIVESALPVVTQVTVLAGAYGADEQYAASGACLSTLASFITIPVLMVIMS